MLTHDLMIQWQASTGRQFNEILRVIDSLQLGDKHKITTPANWTPGPLWSLLSYRDQI